MSYFRPEIERMEGYTPGEQPLGGKFIKLNTNENPYPPSPSVAAAIRSAIESGLARYPDPLARAFRERAAALLGVEPDWIVCGNGSDDILTIVTRALVGAGERVRYPYPSYLLYGTLAAIQGARCEETPFQADWTLDDAFAAPRPDLRCAFLANPNSPTGTVIPPERVLEIAERLECPLLVDEAYADFAPSHCVDLVRRNERILVARTLSKSYALAGLRFGYLVAQPPMIEQFRKVKDSYNCDTLSIAGATAAIDDQDWFRHNRNRILSTRGRMTDRLRRLGFSVIDSNANFVWAEHADRPARGLYEQLKGERILVRYMDYPGWRDGLRISVGTDEQMDAFFSLVKAMV
ncbi:MAG: histidinol-phosphate transaminase [Planctomycetes bacterium]|nr:histidinol-phosphate transaminase [Planctomycetota bacterium]